MHVAVSGGPSPESFPATEPTLHSFYPFRASSTNPSPAKRPRLHLPPPGPAAMANTQSEAHLDSIFHVGGLVDTALAHRVGAHTNRLLYHVAVTKNQVLPMELLQETKK